MAGWTNTVPQGVIGTGNAQVFDNPVAAQFGNQLQNLRRQQELQAQQLAKQMRDNELAVSGGTLWADQVASIEKAHITEGAELQKQGINPYTSMDPRAIQYRQKRAEVVAKQKFRENAEREAVATKKFIRDNLDKLEPEDIQKYNDYLSNTKLDEAFTGNYAPPPIRTRFDDAAFLKSLDAPTTSKEFVDKQTGLKIKKEGVDQEAAKNILVGAYMSNPRGKERLMKVTQGLDPRDVEGFSASYDDNLKNVEKYYEGLGDAEKEKLAAKGLVYGSPEFKNKVREIADNHTQIRKEYDTFVKSGIARMSPGVKTVDSELPYEENLSRERLDEQIRHNQAMEAKAREGSGSGGGNVEIIDRLPLPYGKGGKETVIGEGVLKIPIPKKNFVGATAIDLATGQPNIKLTKSSNDYEVVSVGNYPILTKDVTINRKDGSKILLKKGALAQNDYAEKYPQNVEKRPLVHVQEKIGSAAPKDRLVDYNYLPKVGLTKVQKEALGAFKPATAQPAQPAKTETVTFTDNGVTYNIPKDKVGAFLKSRPKAKRQ